MPSKTKATGGPKSPDASPTPEPSPQPASPPVEAKPPTKARSSADRLRLWNLKYRDKFGANTVVIEASSLLLAGKVGAAWCKSQSAQHRVIAVSPFAAAGEEALDDKQDTP